MLLYIRRALQNMQKALTYFYCLNWIVILFVTFNLTSQESSPGGNSIRIKPRSFPRFCNKKKKKSNGWWHYSLPTSWFPRTNVDTKVMYALCPHKLNLWCQSDHPLGCKLCMYFLSETFGHCQGTKSTWTTHSLATHCVFCTFGCGLLFGLWSFFFSSLVPFVRCFFFLSLFVYCHGMSGSKITINK
jgi:hypothetical protein